MADTILVRVGGMDHPGITAGLMEVLAASDVELYDVEQVVVRGRLTLGLLISVPEGTSTIKDLLFHGWQSGLDIDFEVVEEAPPERGVDTVVTVIGPTVDPAAFGAVAGAIAGAGGNIERISRLSRYPVVSYEIGVRAGDAPRIRADLLRVAARHGIDVAVQPEGLTRRAKRLVVLDVDSTLIQDEVIDLLAAEAGVEDEVAGITRRAMAGELDFRAALEERVRRLAGLDQLALERVRRRIRLTPGARTFIRTLQKMGMKTAIVSGGFTVFVDRIAEELGVDHAVANELEIEAGRLTGRILGPVVDRGRKAAILAEVAEREGIPLDQVVAVGDGANDVDMLARAGLGVAFNAKPALRDVADTSVSVPYLDAILFLLGVRGEDVDATDPVPVEGLPPV